MEDVVVMEVFQTSGGVQSHGQNDIPVKWLLVPLHETEQIAFWDIFQDNALVLWIVSDCSQEIHNIGMSQSTVIIVNKDNIVNKLLAIQYIL
jgi:hypothetical protein